LQSSPSESPSSGNAQRWIVSQEGTRQTYSVPLSFHRLGLLRTMYTDIWWPWARQLLKRGPAGTRALATRFNREIPSERVVSFNQFATVWRIGDHLRRRFPDRRKMSDEFCTFGRWMATCVRDHLKHQELDSERDCFFGFDTNCLETLEFLKPRGVFTLVDQVDPGLVEEELVIAEAEKWPGWEGIPGRFSQEYWDRLKAEWNLADLILVNSTWSRDALMRQGVPCEKMVTVPLAIDLAADHALTPVNPEGKLTVLWLGSVILRKGIQYLVEAARKLEPYGVEFILAGKMGISQDAIRTFPPNVKIVGRVTRDLVGQFYRQAHVFALPTISDGFAITQLEAMAHGLPVVTTPNCGDVVTDGVDGLIVPARDSQALADALAKLNDDRQLLHAMSRNALQTIQKYDLPSNARMIQQLVSQRRLSNEMQTV
jgi:glycosyltransferase involved in cell wall biosynthesis